MCQADAAKTLQPLPNGFPSHHRECFLLFYWGLALVIRNLPMHEKCLAVWSIISHFHGASATICPNGSILRPRKVRRAPFPPKFQSAGSWTDLWYSEIRNECPRNREQLRGERSQGGTRKAYYLARPNLSKLYY